MRFLTTVSLAALLALPIPALAQDADEPRPMTIDRPSLGTSSLTVGEGVVQIESGVFVQSDRTGGPSATSLPSTLRLGLTDDLEFRIDTALYTWTGGISGFEDPIPGIKWTFAETDSATFGLLANVEVPAGAAAFRSQRLLPGALLLADWDLGGGTGLSLNAGGFGTEDPATGTLLLSSFTAASVSQTFSDLLSGYVEVATLGPEALGDPTTVVANGGLTFQVTEDTALDFAVFRGLSSSGLDWGGTVGIANRW